MLVFIFSLMFLINLMLQIDEIDYLDRIYWAAILLTIVNYFYYEEAICKWIAGV